MGRKKPHEEHENLERWLVSYADFMTLLFATFVVLYALSQSDVSKFAELESSLKNAFDRTVLEGQKSIMEHAGQGPIGSTNASSMVSSLIMEYLSPKYEQDSFKQIQDEVDKLEKDGTLKGVKTKMTDRGLVIMIMDETLNFASGSAKLSKKAKFKLDKIGGIIGRKFIMHYIRVEGHTDSVPFKNGFYPSNWELSSARACSIVRYLIHRFKFKPELFTAVGFADTRPYMKNDSLGNQEMNRRVDIVILKNTYKSGEDARDSIIKLNKKDQQKMKEEQLQTINSVLGLSDAAKELTERSSKDDEKVIIINAGNKY